MAEGIRIQPGLEIPEQELEWRADPSGGPGGQHANRSQTRVTVRFDIEASTALTDSQRNRLRSKLGSAVSITSDRTRSQSRNRTDAADRLAERIREGDLDDNRPAVLDHLRRTVHDKVRLANPRYLTPRD